MMVEHEVGCCRKAESCPCSVTAREISKDDERAPNALTEIEALKPEVLADERVV